MKEIIAFIIIAPLLLFGLAYCGVKTFQAAALLDLKMAGIDVQTKGEWIKFSNQGVWCRPAREYSEHAQICQEDEPKDEK